MLTVNKRHVLNKPGEVTDLAITPLGGVMVVGYPNVSTIRVVEFAPVTGDFVTTTTLAPPNLRNFGYAVAISDDGFTIAVGHSTIAVEDMPMAPEFTHVNLYVKDPVTMMWLDGGAVDVGLNGITPNSIRLSVDGTVLLVGAGDLTYTIIDHIDGPILDTEDLPLKTIVFNRDPVGTWAEVKSMLAGNIDGLNQAFGGNAWLGPLGDTVTIASEWNLGADAGCRLFGSRLVGGIWSAPVLELSKVGNILAMNVDHTVLYASRVNNDAQVGMIDVYTKLPGSPWPVLPTPIPKPLITDDLLFGLQLATDVTGAWMVTTAHHHRAPSGVICVYHNQVFIGTIVTDDVFASGFGKVIRVVGTVTPTIYVTNDNLVYKYDVTIA